MQSFCLQDGSDELHRDTLTQAVTDSGARPPADDVVVVQAASRRTGLEVSVRRGGEQFVRA